MKAPHRFAPAICPPVLPAAGPRARASESRLPAPGARVQSSSTILPPAGRGPNRPPIHLSPVLLQLFSLPGSVTIPIAGRRGSVQRACIRNAHSRAG
jgi:hypothetical protein